MAENGQMGPLAADIKAVDAFIGKLEGRLMKDAVTPNAGSKKKGSEKKKGDVESIDTSTVELPAHIAAFEKCDIRVSQILTCVVPKYSEKLLILTIDVGNGEEVREFAAGISKYYKPEELIGRRIMTILNLKPRPMASGAIVSNAMLFCGSYSKDGVDEVVKLCLPPQNAPPGTRVTPRGYTAKDPRPLMPAPVADPKKNFSRMAEHLTTRNGLVFLGDLELVAGEYGPISVDVPDGSHVG